MNAEISIAQPVPNPVPKKEKKRYIYPPEKIREYNKRMYDKNRDKERYECPICFGVYTYYNKSHHTHTELHQRAIKFLEDQKEKKMNPPTLDKQIKGTIVYLDEEHYCKDCKDFFQDDVVHLCPNQQTEGEERPKISLGEDIKIELLINGVLE